MQVYTELVPPTAVTHAVSLPFLNSQATNLVVAKTSLLQVYELKSVTTDVEDASNDENPLDAEFPPLQRIEHTSKLVLIGEYPLAGTVLSMARIKTLDSKSTGEALLIHFQSAKLSLIEWDPEEHSISTVSIHYYEGEELQGSPFTPDLDKCDNFLTADPSSRCAALKFGARSLAILPFRQAGDELVEDYDPDMDDDLDEPKAKDKPAIDGVNGAEEHKTPYKSSFVLPLTALDPALTVPVHLAFLHEYREPTFGIISAPRAAAPGLLQVRKDILTYTVFTLDLEQRASTTLLSVPGLPYDVSRVVPLALPVGGALLLGANELIHVDQAGKTNGIAVNEFAKYATSFSMADQSDLGLKLEGCVVEQLSADVGDLLIILRTGELVILSFKMDGRSVSGMTLEPVPEDRGGRLLPTAATCLAHVGRGRIFVGSEDGDSVLLGCNRKTTQQSRKRSHAEMLGEDADISFDEEDLDDADDDLYGDDDPSPVKRAASPSNGNASSTYTFRIHDTLLNLGPMKDVALGKPSNRFDNGLPKLHDENELELVVSSGRGKAGGLVVLNHDIDPIVLSQSDFKSTRALWSVHARRPAPKDLPQQNAEADVAADADYDRFLVVSRSRGDQSEETVIYDLNGKEIQESTKGEFEREAGVTVDVGVLANGTRIVHVTRTEIRSYEPELGLAQILPLEDEETGVEIKAIGASFMDPYLLLLFEDSSVRVYQADKGGDIEEIDRGDPLLATKWISGCIYRSSYTDNKPLAFLLSAEGGLHIYEIPILSKPIYVAEGLSFLPRILTSEYTARRSAAKAALTEILVADLGDVTAKSPYLIVRTSTDHLDIYQPYQWPLAEGGSSFTTNLRWLKIPQPHLPKYTEEPALEAESERTGRESILRPLDNVNGYATVAQVGTSPSFILKEASSAPRVLQLRGKAVKGLTRFHTDACEKGFAYVNVDGQLRICQLPPNARYGDLGWVARKVPLGEEVQALAYYPPRDAWVVGTGKQIDFTLPEDTYHHEWATEDTTLKPVLEQGYIKLLHPQNWSVIDTYELDPYELVMCVKTLNLEVSETTHDRKQLVAVGTAQIRGEDLATKGCIYIFEIPEVVPEPGRPETNRKLRLICREEVKGAVTAVSEIGTQGFLLMAQGQKCMVRGLKEDGTLLPVAFMDMQCYVTVAKELKGTGLVLMGDAAKGVWLTGYTEEPYKMRRFGKGRSHMEVMTAEFLPHEGQLYFLVADADNNMHVLQFNPDNPKSLAGQRLLHNSTFHTGHFATTTLLLPSTINPAALSANGDPAAIVDKEGDNSPSEPQLLHHVLVAHQSGALALVTPLAEHSYRRLSALQTFLQNSLDFAAGLNPRAYRAVESEGFGSRGMLDGAVLARWAELGRPRQLEGLAKVGAQEWELLSDLEIVCGGGLGYL